MLLGMAAVLMAGPAACDKYSAQKGDEGDATSAPAPTETPEHQPERLPSEQSEGVEAADAPTAQAPAPVSATGLPRESDAAPRWRPLLDARVGEWAVYDTLEGRRLRYEAVHVAPSGVATRVSVTEGGRAWGAPATREDDPDSDPITDEAQRRQASRTTARESLRVAGRTWDAILYEDRWEDEQIRYVRRTWVHPQVPCFGTLRMELRGDGDLEARLELVDYGPR